ncbi:FtsQ-type POTRA domain-containing protein [Treponema socranskii]|uniref:cell division protein FtsQ/DivIB n=1 Tax=Treponema socranskii TaxID=53419 RepID=UPI003D8C824B
MSDVSMAGFAAEKKETKSDAKTKIVVALFFVFCAIFLIEIAVYKFALPSMHAPKIVIGGERSLSDEQVLSLLQPMHGANWFSFNAEEAVSILSSVPAIDSVTVTKRFPDKIFVRIAERESVAMTFVSSAGRSIPVCIDKNGVLFDDAEVDRKSGAVPIISGLPIEHLSEGMRIPAKYRTLIEQISEIQNRDRRYFAALAEICVVPKEYGNYELALIPAHTRMRVLTDRALNEDALQYMMVVLDVVNSIEPDVSEIDLRYGSVSYRTR